MKLSTCACCWAALSLCGCAVGCVRRSTTPSPTTTSSETSKQPPPDVRAEIRRLATDPEAVAKEFIDAVRFDEPKVSYDLASPLYRRFTKFSKHEEYITMFRNGVGKIRQQQTWDQSVGISPDGVYSKIVFRIYGEVQPADAMVTLIQQSD